MATSDRCAHSPLDLWREVFEGFYGASPPLTMGVEAVPDLDSQGQFREKEIDEMRAQKDEELRLYRQVCTSLPFPFTLFT